MTRRSRYCLCSSNNFFEINECVGFVSRYPPGYTIIFICYYSTVYHVSYGHWAVYNERQEFYGFDDGDATEDFYDYDSGDRLPAGCNFTVPGQDILGTQTRPWTSPCSL